MARGDEREGIQTIYGALLGGLIASAAGILVFGAFLNSSGPVGDDAPLYAMFTGMACVIVFMVGGAYFEGRLVWLARTLLFASGFTAMWTAALSIAAEPRWIAAVGYGLMIVTGIGLGMWRFRPDATDSPAARSTGSEATWIH